MEMRKERLAALRFACNAFLVSSSDSTEPLEKAIKAFNATHYDYEEIVRKREYAIKEAADRAASRLPLPLLDQFDLLFGGKCYTEEDCRQWAFAAKLLLNQIDQDMTLLTESEAIKWLARSIVFVKGPELHHLFIKLWPFCVSEESGRVSSILAFMANSLPTNSKEILKDHCKLDENTKYNHHIVHAYRELKRGW